MGGRIRDLVRIGARCGHVDFRRDGRNRRGLRCTAKAGYQIYDYLIIGTAIHGGKGPKEFEELIQANIADVKSKVKAYYVVCGNGGDRPNQQTQERYIDNYLAKLCQASVPANRVFSGRITKALLSEEDIKRLEGVFHPFEDYDHLSRWDCLQFGRQILTAASAPAKSSNGVRAPAS